MNTNFLIAAALIAAGIFALMYGQFSYTKESDHAKLGPIELSVSEKHTVNIPTWAGAGAIAAGAVLLAYGAAKR